MTRGTAAGLALVLGAASLGAQIAPVSMRPGSYEVSAELEFAGTKTLRKTITCITPEMLKDFSKVVLQAEDEQRCKVSGYRVTGDKVEFTTSCAVADIRMTSKSEITFTTDSFTGLTNAADQAGLATTIRMSGKRVGECKE
jgi:hypothetical protein